MNYRSSSTSVIHLTFKVVFKFMHCCLSGLSLGEEHGHVFPTPSHDSFTHILTDVYTVLIYADVPFLALGRRE